MTEELLARAALLPDPSDTGEARFVPRKIAIWLTRGGHDAGA